MGKFKTKARAIELLGKKQIRDSVTGLSEIMKNSYDADAGLLRVEFNTKNVKSPFIIIYDTGCGMNAYDFENKWLVLGTESKKINKRQTTKKGRILMGEKGIGRLAVARLGQQTMIISKTKKSEWNMIYLNWSVFENPLLMIDEVLIPSAYGFEIEKIDTIKEQILNEQKQNLESEAWQDERYQSLRKNISKQIDELIIPCDTIREICALIESEENQGTVIFVFDLNEDWDKYLEPSQRNSNSDINTDMNYDRLASFISDFQHVGEKKQDRFIVEIFHNSNLLEFNYDFNEEDFNKYDLKIEGYIDNGKFYGKLLARNADANLLLECNEQLEAGLEITSGLVGWKAYQCGKFDVKICHVEGRENNSGLTPEEYAQITKKMSISGGVAVYRDNVRILPYGEIENDYLNIERRRTLSAGQYLFSHRNMFGRIDITSENNPLLEDKSSREGLIENNQYYYFLTTLQNLLMRIAKEYVTNAYVSSKYLRQSYVGFNNEQAEEKIKKEQAEKEEEKRLLEYRTFVAKTLKNNQKEFDLTQKYINQEFDILRISFKCDSTMSYTELIQLLDALRLRVNSISCKIFELEKLKIKADQRFNSSLDETIIDELDIINRQIFDYMNTSKKQLDTISQDIKTSITDYVNAWLELAKKRLAISPVEYVEQINIRALGVIHKTDELMSELKQYYSQRREKVKSKMAFVEQIDQESMAIGRKNIGENFQPKMDKLKVDLYRIQNESNRLLEESPDIILQKGDLLNKHISQYEDNLNDYYTETTKSIDYNFGQLDSKAEFLNYYLSDNNLQNSNELIGGLKKRNIELESQVEVYTDLANLGLSAEIVNHEFNQLFTNVYDAIKQMKYEPLNSDAKYLLKQIEIGFRAISDRQSQLSPMYRSRNMNKKIVFIRSMVDDIYKFFKERFLNNDIQFINEVDSNVNIELSLSKVYPVLSNLINNSIYWVSDREERKILFHFVAEENALYVEDTGPGVPVKYVKKVFDPFFTLKSNGRGLGLTIAKKVLESQGHDIDTISSGEYKRMNGACFRIIFANDSCEIEGGE